jgi:thiamine monophosphate synthase
MNEQTRNAAPECGLYIRIDPAYEFEVLLAQLRDIFFVAKLSKYERNMHVLEFPTAGLNAEREEEIRGMIAYTRKSGFVAIVRGDAALAQQWEADGVLLEQAEGIMPARALLGDDAIIGLRCGESRSLAEESQMLDADYVTFHAAVPEILLPPDMVGWWATRSENPVLIEGPVTNETCALYVRAGATFIESTRFVFDHPQGVKQGTADMMFAIELALERWPVN